jgi:tRNA-Thr(GGU) m(6)t(6)A37 methyltransferase TsaA
MAQKQTQTPTTEHSRSYRVFPVGRVRRENSHTLLDILPAYTPALKELDGFSHVQVLWWFSQFDEDPYRQITQTEHAPYEAPVLGVFACRSPVRPNPLGLTTAPILHVDHDAGVIEVRNIDALDGTPILDLKAYVPSCDRVRTVSVPQWASAWPDWLPEEGLGLEAD